MQKTIFDVFTKQIYGGRLLFKGAILMTLSIKKHFVYALLILFYIVTCASILSCGNNEVEDDSTTTSTTQSDNSTQETDSPGTTTPDQNTQTQPDLSDTEQSPVDLPEPSPTVPNLSDTEQSPVDSPAIPTDPNAPVSSVNNTEVVSPDDEYYFLIKSGLIETKIVYTTPDAPDTENVLIPLDVSCVKLKEKDFDNIHSIRAHSTDQEENQKIETLCANTPWWKFWSPPDCNPDHYAVTDDKLSQFVDSTKSYDCSVVTTL